MIKSGAKERLSEAVEKALDESKGLLKIESLRRRATYFFKIHVSV
jgi:hypothetical protein